jgi:multidrug efflux pump subunit AcrA (membrane-fusion protein)
MGILTVGIIGSTATVYLTSRHPAAPTDINHLTVAVKQENLTLEIQASGSVRPIESVNISPKTSGRLTELLVEKGDRVKEGQVIARMEDTEIRAQLIEAQANLSRQEASLSELLAGSRPEDIAQGRARLSQTEARLAQLLAGSRLEDIAQALDRPQRPLFIGRKPCLPVGRLVAGWVDADTVLQALQLAPVPHEHSGLRAQWPDGEGQLPGDRLVDVCDERNWTSGVHGGWRPVREGLIKNAGNTP